MPRTPVLENYIKKSVVLEQAQWDAVCEIAAQKRVPRTQVIREALDLFLAISRSRTPIATPISTKTGTR